MATRAALQIVKTEDWRRARLNDCVVQFQEGANRLGLRLMPSTTPIQPLLIGEAAQAIAVSEALKMRGILVPAIRPPTVPKGSSRLRFTFSSSHQSEDIDRLLAALSEIKGSLL